MYSQYENPECTLKWQGPRSNFEIGGGGGMTEYWGGALYTFLTNSL